MTAVHYGNNIAVATPQGDFSRILRFETFPFPRRRFTDEAARERKKLDSEVVETVEMKTKRLEKAVREETIKEQVQVRFLAAMCGRHGSGRKVALPWTSLKVLLVRRCQPRFSGGAHMIGTAL